jgi:two-component system chemotaxis sensor kinase CheA
MASEIVVNEFVAEASEHLINTERDLLEMDNGGAVSDPDAVHRVFRAMHSIKGASGTFGFPAVMELSHAMESVLALIRDGAMIPDEAKVSALLSGVDKLRSMIEDIHASNDMDYGKELHELKSILQGGCGTCDASSGGGTECPKAVSPGVRLIFPRKPDLSTVTLKTKDPCGAGDIEFNVDMEELTSAVSGCHFVCLIRTGHDKNIEEEPCAHENLLAKLHSYGQCLGACRGSKEKVSPGSRTLEDKPSHFLFSTILEPDLIGSALNIPEESVQVVDPDLLAELLRKKPEPCEPPIVSEPTPSLPPVGAASSSTHADKAPHSNPETIRVHVALLDTLINLAGELVLGRNQLRQILEPCMDENPGLRAVIHNVNLATSEMQEHILQMRMQPLDTILNRLRRLVRDLSRQLRKEVELFIQGGEVELDKSMIEGLIDPLVHIIRNCVDHGIETPREREAIGKPPKGEIRLRAFHEGGQVNITISDDGRGMDVGAVIEKALARGVLSVEEAARRSEKEKLNLVFLPGFTTAKTLTDVSGRGVGMDVVKNNVESFGGHIEIDSTAGSGTTIRINIPLTLAIIPSLIVGAAGQRFAIPQVNVRELVCIRAEDVGRRIEKIGAAPVLRLRERLLPLVRLADTVGLVRTLVHPLLGEEIIDRRANIADRRRREDGPAVCEDDRRCAGHERRQRRQSDIFVAVLRAGANLFGLIVDELFDIEEIVVKPLLEHIKDCQCFAGATIMGDGRVAMILDVAGIAALARLRFAEVNAEQARRQAEELHRHKFSSAVRQSIIVFNNAPEEHFAAPLPRISRLEKILPRAVESIGGHEFIAYRGKPLPLFRLESFLPVRPLAASSEELYVLIPKPGDGPAVGIMVSKIVDILQSDAVVEKTANTPPGFLGSAVVEDRITMFLDMDGLMKMFRKEISAV